MHAKRRRSWVILFAGFCLLLGLQLVPAAAEIPVLLAQEERNGNPGPTVVFHRNNILDYILVVLLFGAALFAICRSSNRN